MQIIKENKTDKEEPCTLQAKTKRQGASGNTKQGSKEKGEGSHVFWAEASWAIHNWPMKERAEPSNW